MQPVTNSYSSCVRILSRCVKTGFRSLFFGVLILHIVSYAANAAMGGFGGPTCPPAPTVTLSVVNNPSLNASGSELIRVATDSLGTLYAASVFSGTVKVYDKNGVYMGDISGFQRPVSVATATNRIYVGDMATGSVSIVNSSGQIIGALGGGAAEFGMPSSIVVDGAGNVLVTDSNTDSVKIYGSDGVFKSSFGATGAGNGQFKFPTGITYDPTYDEVYVVDHKNGRVQVFSPAGAFLRAFRVQQVDAFGNPAGCTVRLQGIAVSNGKVYISDAYQGTVWVYRRDGTYLNKIGNYGSGTGNLNLPMGLAMANMKLQVSNTGNERVEVFDVRDQNALLLSPSALIINAYYNMNPVPQVVQVSSEVTGAVVPWTASSTSPFVSLGSSSGLTPSPVIININTSPGGSPLPVGQYQGTVNFTSNGINYPLKITLNILSVQTLIVTKSGTGNGTVTSLGGEINCGSTCSAQIESGTTVTLSATAAANSVFTGWSGACIGTGACLVTMDRTQTVTATFTPVQYSLNLTRTGNGTGNVTSNPAGIDCGTSCSYSFDYGTDVLLTAMGSGASTFSGWSGECVPQATPNQCRVTINGVKNVTAKFLVKGDLTGDGKTDILWHNEVTGQTVVWFMDGTLYAGLTTVGLAVEDVNWKIVGTGDFNGDGKMDILWRNEVTGQNAVWFMDGTTYTGLSLAGPAVEDVNWKIVGTGDFNGNGKTDILWRNEVTGQNVIWFMDGTTYTGLSLAGPAVEDVNWKIVGTGDFNGDGKTDILWHNESTGQTVVWFMDGTTYTGLSLAGPVVEDVNWKIVGTGDFNGDGKTDILWRNESTGQTVVWFMDGTTYTGQSLAGPLVMDKNWKIKGIH